MKPAARHKKQLANVRTHHVFLVIVTCIAVAILWSQRSYFHYFMPGKVFAVTLFGYSYQRTITLTNSGGTLTNYDILVQLDTASLITAGKMQATCDDTRFIDSDGSTQLAFWLEQGCNTASTQYWVRVPSIPTGSKDITIFYGNSNDGNESQYWTGNFITMNNASCASGWTQVSALNSKFPRGNSSYGGTGGSSATHTHAVSGTTSGGGSSGGNCLSGGASSPSDYSHTHTYSFTTGASDTTPSYLDVVYCSKTAPIDIFNTQYIVMYGTVPSGWSNLTAMNGKFPRGNTSYSGTPGGSDTHQNSIPSTVTSGPSNQRAVFGGFNSYFSEGHTHTFSGNLDAANHLPPYVDYIPATVTSGTKAFGDTAIAFFDVAPPFGWTRVSSLDTKFPRGNSSSGGTGGATSHTHTFSITAPAPGGGAQMNESTNWGCTYSTHIHTVSGSTSPAVDNIPPYVDVLIYQRNTDAVSQNWSAETGPSPTPTPIQVPGVLNVSATTATFSANLFAQIFYDVANPAYFLDPAGSQSLVTAGKTSIATTSATQTLNLSGNIGFTHGMIKDAAGKLQFQAGGSRAGSGGSASIYFLDSSGTVRGRFDTVTTSGQGYGTMYLGATNTSETDVAEHYASHEALMPGEVVVLDTTNSLHIKKAVHAYDGNILGIVSTNPGVILGQGDVKDGSEATYPVALSGRVPVLIDPASEPIHVGDYLTSSDAAGKATRATHAGFVVGRALEDWPARNASASVAGGQPNSGKTTIQAFVHLSYYLGDIDSQGTLVTKTVNALTVTDTITGNDDIRGSVAIKQGETSVWIPRQWTTAPKTVNLTPSWDTSVFVGNITSQGFTIRLAKPPAKQEQVYWKAWW